MFRSKDWTMVPVTSAVKKADNGRTMVMKGSSSAQVTAMESTPVSGVEIRKAAVGPLAAPCRRNPAAVGNTPQLQSGMGTPTAAALTSPRNDDVPRCLATRSSGKKALSTPARKKPKSMYGAEATSTSHPAKATCNTQSMFTSKIASVNAQAIVGEKLKCVRDEHMTICSNVQAKKQSPFRG